jgi:CDP-diacylglycerol pyrophosphatase
LAKQLFMDWPKKFHFTKESDFTRIWNFNWLKWQAKNLNWKKSSIYLKPTVLIVNLTLKSRKMENHLYICKYCSKIQTNRRQKQKYCSNSCRTELYY